MKSAATSLLVILWTIAAQAQTGMWTPAKPSGGGDLVVRDGFFRVYKLDARALSTALNRAPSEDRRGDRPAAVIPFAMPDGTFAQISVVESPIVDPRTAAQLGGFATYIAKGVDDRSIVGRLDNSPYGFHGALSMSGRTVYIDPYGGGNSTLYISYDTSAFIPQHSLKCGVVSRPASTTRSRHSESFLASNSVAGANAGQLRTYRLAIAATGEFTLAMSAPGTIDLMKTLASIASVINRVDAIYERDLAIRFVLVPKELLLIFDDPANDPYDATDDGQQIGANQTVIDQRIGAGNYDLGQVFSNPSNGSGLSSVGAGCANGWKAQSVIGEAGPGGPMLVYGSAHELAHVLGAPHSFDSQSGQCAGSRDPLTAFEPGPGSTIMSYGFADCTPDNLPGVNVDLYFHTSTIEDVLRYTVAGTGSTCPNQTVTLNSPPVLAPIANHTIPQDTPFVLSAFAVDPNEGDQVTFTFEEMDVKIVPIATPVLGWALFRSRPPDVGQRTFPIMSDVLNGQRTFGELLPQSGRNLNFRVTARDNHMGGGNVSWQDVTLTVEGLPFRVLSPNAPGIIWPAGSQQAVTWTPNGASRFVNILLSTNAGATWTSVLPNVPNSGFAMITVPAVSSSRCRIKVEAADNIFFNTTQNDFLIFIPPPAPVWEGEHTSTTCVGVQGWAWDKANPLNTANVDVYENVNSNLVLRQAALPAIGTSPGIGDGTSAFNWVMPRSMKDGSVRVFDVRFTGTAIDLQNTPQMTSTGGCSLEGVVDVANCTHVRGWAQDPSLPADVIAVNITAVDSAGNTTQIARGLLANAPGSNGNHYFDVQTNLSGSQTIHVTFWDTNKELTLSPQTLSCP